MGSKIGAGNSARRFGAFGALTSGWILDDTRRRRFYRTRYSAVAKTAHEMAEAAKQTE